MNKQQQRAAKIARQQQLVNAAKAANRSLTAEEQSEFDTLQREIDTLAAEIAADEAQQQRQATGTTPEGTPAPEGTPTDAQRAVEAERTRITDITAMCRDFGVDPADYISNGTTVDQVRAAILEQLRTNRAPLSTSVQVTGSGEDEFRRDASDALLLRCSRVAVENPTPGARQLQGMSLRDLGIECLMRDGQHNASALLRMSGDDLYAELSRQFYNPTAAYMRRMK